MYDRTKTTWKGDRLFVQGKRNPMAEVVRDARYPNMWRVRLLPNGELSEMVNLSRAKDAACGHAIAVLNRGECPAAAPRIDETPALVPEPPPAQKPLYGATRPQAAATKNEEAA